MFLSLSARIYLLLGLTLVLMAIVNSALETADLQTLAAGGLPRIIVSLLAGGGLALAGSIMQQALRNPLATPTTLGVVSGAQFALLAATLLAPGLLVIGREWVALSGGAFAMGTVVLLAWSSRLAPMAVILAGLIVNLYLGSLSIVMLLIHQEELNGILIWGAGSLAQSGWDGVGFLWPRLLLIAPLAIVLARPLDVLSLGDTQARSLGISLHHIRLAALGTALFLTACITSVVGVVGFIGLAAPAAARLLGARSFMTIASCSVLIGALLLAVIDILLQALSASAPVLIPTGAMTAVLGGPLLLWLLFRLKITGKSPRQSRPALAPARHQALTGTLLLLVLLATVSISLGTGRAIEGWLWFDLGRAATLLEWRLPRILAAGGAGTVLALAGVMVQRLTQNPMASPELLGISGGAALGLVSALFLLQGATMPALITAGFLGALAGIAIVIALNRRSGFNPQRLLLTGVAVTATASGIQALLLAGGDPRGQQAIAWMSGSTYYVDFDTALAISMVAMIALVITPFFARWLDLLPLGRATGVGRGLDVERSRLILLLLVALLTATATLIVGPLSFVGLLAPHMARMIGFTSARNQLLGAAGLGSMLMVSADWIGRQALYPQEIPAGLVASLIGGLYFIVGMRRV